MSMMSMDTNANANASGRRKRERSLEHPDEDLEFMPLSKRITCLNLNPGSEEARGLGQGQGQGSPFHNNGHGQGSSSGGRGNGNGSHAGSSVGSEPLSDSQSSSQSVTDYMYKNAGFDETSNDDYDMSGQSEPNGFHGSTVSVFQQIPNGGMGGNGFGGASSGYESQNAFLYEPSLDELSNPYYYEQNRHLFDLYLERMNRNNMTPHPYLLRVRDEMNSRFGN